MPPKRKATSSHSKPVKKPRGTVADDPGNVTTHLPASPAQDPTIPTVGTNGALPTLPIGSMVDVSGPDAVATESKDDGHDWEVLNGQTRDPLIVGTAAAIHLILTFRHRTTKEVVQHEYMRKKKEDINWNDSKDIQDINKWRTHIFRFKMKFPAKVEKHLWSPYETAYLELVYEAIQKAISVEDHPPMPHENKIFERFNAFFDKRSDIRDKKGRLMPPLEMRDKVSLATYVRRPNSVIRAHREVIQSSLIDQSDSAWNPKITDAEIETHLANSKTGVPPKTKTTKIAKGGPNKLSGAVTNSKPGSSNASSIDDILQIQGPSYAGKANGIMPGTDSPARGSKGPDAPTLPPSTESRERPSTTSGAGQTLPKQNNRPCPPAIVTTEEEFQKLRDDGWSVPDLPMTDEEALERHRESENDASRSDQWHILAEISLEDRMNRRPELALGYYKRNEGRLAFYKDLTEEDEDKRNEQLVLKAKGQAQRGLEEGNEGNAGGDIGDDKEGATKRMVTEEEEDESEDEYEGEVQRRDGAAAANCLLGYATIPPFGYQGNIRDLETDPRFLKSERNMAETNVIALRKFHAAQDEAFDKGERSMMEEENASTKTPE
jgi:hypothetical protein